MRLISSLLIVLVLLVALPALATVSPMPSESGAFTDFIGASSDTKPIPSTWSTAGSKVISGSRFYEYDTQNGYIYNIDSGWTVTQTPDTP